MKPTAASSVIDRKGELLRTHGDDGRAINLGSDQRHNFWEIAQTFQKLVDRNTQHGPHDAHFIVAKVSTMGMLLTLIKPMPG
jgi:hypothetical protein